MEAKAISFREGGRGNVPKFGEFGDMITSIEYMKYSIRYHPRHPCQEKKIWPAQLELCGPAEKRQGKISCFSGGESFKLTEDLWGHDLLSSVLRGRSKRQLEPSGMYPPGGLGTDYDVERLVIQGHKVKAIKLYRQIHNLSLNEAKHAIDQIAKRLGKA